MRSRDLATLEFDQVCEHLAQFACSAAGKEACRALRPRADGAEATRALEAAWQCLRLVGEHGQLPLAEFPDIRAALKTAAHEGFVLDGKSLVEIHTVLTIAQATRAFLKRHAGTYTALAALPERLIRLPSLQAALARTLDEHGGVTDDASDELARVRRTVRQLREQLTRRLDELLTRPPTTEFLVDRYVTVRNNRFVLPIKTALAAQFEGVMQDRSVSGETTFIEPLFAVDLNNRLLMAAKEEEALVRRILADLTMSVLAEHPAISGIFAALVDIDLLVARARFGQHYHCTQPQLGGSELALKQARHPLLLFAERDVVPIDLLMPADKRVLVITGPNTGGKTVALKTIGLLALMAQSGILIPAAEGSCLPCFAGIYADLGDEQSIERNLSTFSGHVANLTEIIERYETPALVLLDEPGIGTDPDDGAALGIGIIQVLETSGVRVVISTHYAPIKVFALSHPTCLTAAVEFDLQAMAPRYRLLYHSVGESLALPIARRLGLPGTLLRAAEAARSEQARALAVAVERLECSRREYEERLTDLNERLHATAAAQQAAQTLLAELQAKRRQHWGEELRAARDFVHSLREQGRELLAAIERGAADRRALAHFLQAQEALIAQQEEAMAPQPASSLPPQRGDQVEVKDTGIRGELVSIEGERAWLQRGSMRFEVPAGQLRRLSERTAPAVDIRLAAVPEDVPQEISLLGLRAKDAVAQLEEFLDRAMQAGGTRVRIIHGVGSGALRRAVAEYLARSPYCTRFRAAEPGQGGAGVTIAELGGE